MTYPNHSNQPPLRGNAKPDQDADSRAAYLAQWTHHHLRQLPDIAAPATLQASVWRAVALRQRQWWRQPLLHWPLWARCVVLALTFGCVIGVQSGWGDVGSGMQALLRLSALCWQLLTVFKHTLFQLLIHAPQVALLGVGVIVASVVVLVTGIAGLGRLTAR